ncbi:MAG: T9SS type A sorting domain-containing protein [Bacteroidia bacterium]
MSSKCTIELYGKKFIYLTLLMVLCFYSKISFSQSAVSAISYSDTNLSISSKYNVKGAGIRNGGGTMFSSWDSSANYNFTINYNASNTSDIRKITQATVSGISYTLNSVAIPDAYCRIRRLGNSSITNDRNHFNYWMRSSSYPNTTDSNGSFNINAPEINSAEEGFIQGNLNTGIDNAFSNDDNYLHNGNIERIDLIAPHGISPYNNTAISESGFIIIDRGVGDDFGIAAIDSLDAFGNPASYLNILKVSASDFGSSNIIASSSYIIFVHDTLYSGARPSVSNSQGQRGVFISLADLDISSTNQTIYGISVFGDDVNSTYNLVNYQSFPNNTGAGGGLDITAHIGLFKTSLSALPIHVLRFEGERIGNINQIKFLLSETYNCNRITFEHSIDEEQFNPLFQFESVSNSEYQFDHYTTHNSHNFYRLKIELNDGSIEYSKILQMNEIKNSSEIFKINPNPSKGTFRINAEFPISLNTISIELYTPLGQSVPILSYLNSWNSITIQSDSLMNGMYYLHIKTSNDNIFEIKKVFISN